MSGEYIEVPAGLNRSMLEAQFGYDAAAFYLDRIRQRRQEGRVYHDELKTAYIWAVQDKRTNQGFFTSYRGYGNGRKHRNFGGS